MGPSTKIADLAVASAKKRARDRERGGFLGIAGLVRGKKEKKDEEGEEKEKDGSSSSSTPTASSSSPPEPSAIQVEEALVDLFLSLEDRFDLAFSADGGEAKAAKAVTVADASALLAREIELINQALRHIEIV